MARIRLRPATTSARFPLIDLAAGETKTLGRAAQADVIVDDPSLSRLHARLHVDQAGTLRVEDIDSTNGVLINGMRRSESLLDAGDRVQFGSVEYLVALEDDPSPRAEVAIERGITRVPVGREGPPHVDQLTLEALLATSRELMAFDDLPALLERVLDRLQAILKPDRAAILLVDAATGALTPRAVRPRGAYTSVSQFASSTIVREARGARDILLIEDTAQQSRLQHAASLADAGVRSAICVPLLGRTGPIGALYADRLGFGTRFGPDVAGVAAAFAAHAAAALETAKLYDDREQHFRATLEAFARAIDARDAYTAGHSERVTAYTLALARAVHLPDEELETIRRAGMLHDIGKVGVRDAVLLKSGPLDQDERAEMEAHVTLGYGMLEGLSFLAQALPSVRGHHERWDGCGYPDKLAGSSIHLHARLMAVADAYDAMTSARPYRRPLPPEEAARRIRVDSGSQFDPEVVETFDAVEDDFHAIRAAQRAGSS
jgi:putative nucleotidyltransferase with HDIG domain